MMGRKSAPQPLALSESQSQPASPLGSGTYGPMGDGGNVSARSPVSLASPVTETRSTGAPRSPQAFTNSGGGDSGLQVPTTPASSKSPRSPRSPFISKFNINNSKKNGSEPPQMPAPTSPLTSEQKPQKSVLADTEEKSQQEQLAHSFEQAHSLSKNGQAGLTPKATPHSQATKETKPLVSQYNTLTPTSNPAAPRPRDASNNSQSQNRPEHEAEEKHSRSGSRFFNFNKSSKPGPQLHHSQSRNLAQHQEQPDNTASEAAPRGVVNPAPLERGSSKTSKHSDLSSPDHATQKLPSLPSKSENTLASASEERDTQSKKSKNKPFGLLRRNTSNKDQDLPSPKEVTMAAPPMIKEPERAHTFDDHRPLRTAPVQIEAHDRSYRQMMNSAERNHSADRSARRDASANKDQANSRSHPSSLRDNSGSAFLSGLKSSGTRAADIISKGLFGKGGKSASNEKEPTIDDEHYQLKVINLPLVEQTRRTRISKKLEDSRDKTEFWMPAFPWRAIDYLNYNGCDVEGLYRVPGSGPQIKKWQRRFDEELDVDLFSQDDLYDINIIGSMLKAWLRELPDELFPKAAQDRIARECSGSEEVPQLLIDELSNLSPYNYYLLFAITCHLSLLLAHSDKNKMDFRNLCICFQPCMKIDAFCFRFLVCEWRKCWQGCKNESLFIEEEYAMIDQPPPNQADGETRSRSNSRPAVSHSSSLEEDIVEERPSTSVDNGSQLQPQSQQNGKLRKKPLTPSQTNGSIASTSTISTSMTVDSHMENSTSRRPSELRPLSPIKPLSPLGF